MAVRAVYPGSFDPLTNGHLDLIERSLRLFDELVVAVVTNPSKTALFTDDERVEMIRAQIGSLKNVSVAQFGGLVVDFARSHKANIILRGLQKFRIRGDDEGRSYRVARIETIHEPSGLFEEDDILAARRKLESILVPQPSGRGHDPKVPPSMSLA